jgi:hypothetical protein
MIISTLRFKLLERLVVGDGSVGKSHFGLPMTHMPRRAQEFAELTHINEVLL